MALSCRGGSLKWIEQFMWRELQNQKERLNSKSRGLTKRHKKSWSKVCLLLAFIGYDFESWCWNGVLYTLSDGRERNWRMNWDGAKWSIVVQSTRGLCTLPYYPRSTGLLFYDTCTELKQSRLVAQPVIFIILHWHSISGYTFSVLVAYFQT